MKYFLLHKPLGLTPRQALDAYRNLHPEYQSTRLGTAGRLDPMAEGLLVVMVGDENKNQSHYIGLDKTYEVELLLGTSTDSYDLLGMPTRPLSRVDAVDRAALDLVLTRLTGKIIQPYPPYSAVRVNSRPLYWWARRGRLSEISIPSAERTVYSVDLLGIQSVNVNEFRLELANRIMAVTGDFRQAEIVAAWDDIFVSAATESLWSIKLQVVCSSGTFMRGLVDQIGQDLDCGAVTKSIVRTKVGHWELKDAEQLL